MKLFLLSALLIGVTLSQPSKLDLDNELAQIEWESFKATHMKSYASAEEEVQRRTIFLNNLKFINEHNEKYRNKQVSFHVAVNKYADLTNQEFTSTMNGYKPSLQGSGIPFNATGTANLASTVDWREKGAVTPVKDQGSCGGCYAFSTTGALEGQTFLALDKLISLSEQNLIDCSQVVGNKGCKGGNMDASFVYIKNNDGIDTEAYYSFEGKVGDCRYEMANKGAKASGYVDLRSGSEDSLQEAVAKIGPISVAIDATHDSFRFYKGGVYKEENCSTSELDHAVLAVGYSWSFFSGKYWIVKNSWGEDWGEKGYIRMARDHDNMCGIATKASYPTTPYGHKA